HGDADGAPAALRTTDPDYLAAVDRWFAAVMPILADAQVTRGGAVALVQIESELDVFDCPDPEQCMDHLAARAREHGIGVPLCDCPDPGQCRGRLAARARQHGTEVPLIACAGQWHAAGAAGGVDGVVPTVSLCPDGAPRAAAEERRRGACVAALLDVAPTAT